jgi:uncharacterized protein YxjI
MLKENMFLVTPKLLSSNHSYEVRNESGQVLGTAVQSTGFIDRMIGMVKGPPSTKIEFRTKPDNALAFAVRRKGFLFKKVEAVDENGEVIGRYKTKSFSLSGGYHVYDKNGKHIAEIRGKLLKSEYTVFSPDGKTEMGKVSKKWGGMMKTLLSSDGTYGVQISPQFAEDANTKIVILGAAIAIDCLMAKHGKHKAGGKEEGGGEGGGEE